MLCLVESDADERVDLMLAFDPTWVCGIPQEPYITSLVAHKASPYMGADDRWGRRRRIIFEAGLVRRALG